MFIQKIFHVHHSLAETREQLGCLSAFRHQLEGVIKATLTADGVAQFECEVEGKFSLHAVVVELPVDEPDTLLFQSTAGNIQLSGLVEFTEVRPEVTEVQLTLHYQPVSIWHRLYEFCSRRIEHYVERQLRALQGCLDGAFSHSQSAVSAARFMPQLAR